MDSKVAVVMSVYNNDEPQHFKIAIESILTNEHVNVDVFLQVDGSVELELNSTIEYYSKMPNVFVDKSEENLGLATQLNVAINRALLYYNYTYIARMDADDISKPNRLIEQINFFNKNPKVAVIGTNIIEFQEGGGEFIKSVDVDNTSILKKIVKKCPFNHPTVMFNMKVMNANDLKYNSKLMNTQDYYLWVDLLKKGYEFSNLTEPFLYFRITKDFHDRRGFKKAKNDYLARLYAMKELRCYSFENNLYAMLLFFLRVSPSAIKKLAYKYLR